MTLQCTANGCMAHVRCTCVVFHSSFSLCFRFHPPSLLPSCLSRRPNCECIRDWSTIISLGVVVLNATCDSQRAVAIYSFHRFLSPSPSSPTHTSQFTQTRTVTTKNTNSLCSHIHSSHDGSSVAHSSLCFQIVVERDVFVCVCVCRVGLLVMPPKTNLFRSIFGYFSLIAARRSADMLHGHWRLRKICLNGFE